jgi:aarF domain-containing kinase
MMEFGRLGLSLVSAKIVGGEKDEAYFQRLAEKVTMQLCKLRGAPLKLAQMLSIQEDTLIPSPIRRAFEKARESAHVIPKEEVAYMLSRNLGEQWRTRFATFSETPFASASIGQVHRATLPDGSEVAVKVQYQQVK